MLVLWSLCSLLALVAAQGDKWWDTSSYTPCECDDDNCLCVNYKLCSADNEILTDGGNIQMRVSTTKVRRCPGAEKCCKAPEESGEESGEESEEVTTSSTSTSSTSTSTSSTSTSSTSTSSTSTSSTSTSSTSSPLGGCGVRRESTQSRIMSKSFSTSFGEFPWMVAIITTHYTKAGILNGTTFSCGGSLINNKVVLTAAHCIKGISETDIMLSAGNWDFSKTVESLPHQIRRVERVITHPDFNSRTLANDIALLVVKRPFVNAKHIDIVCLPEQGTIYAGKRCIATGWGKTDTEDNVPILRQVELPVLEHKECQAMLRKTRFGRFFRLNQSFLCAGGEKEGESACLGDGGGPLVCEHDDERYYQAGIVAGGLGCGIKGIPGLYSNVPAFLGWIDSELQNVI